MSEPFLGQITMFGGNFAPRGWAYCEGQLLPIAQNTALYSLLGTIYGGDGRTSFGLPDLRGRAPIHQGRGPGLSPRKLGEKGGAETVQPRGGLAAAPATEEGRQSPTVEVANPQAHNSMQPFLAVNYIIALEGVFPSRN